MDFGPMEIMSIISAKDFSASYRSSHDNRIPTGSSDHEMQWSVEADDMGSRDYDIPTDLTTIVVNIYDDDIDQFDTGYPV